MKTYSTLPPITAPSAPAPPRLQRLYNLSEVGEYLRLGPRTLMKAIASGKLVSSFCGRQHLVSESSIEAYLENQQGTSPYGKQPKAQDASTEAK
jgi:excisionase family DNA binding protein